MRVLPPQQAAQCEETGDGPPDGQAHIDHGSSRARTPRSPRLRPEIAILDRVAGRAAGDALWAPFVLGDRADLEALFGRPDLESVAIVARALPARLPSLRTLIEADLRGWLPVTGVHLSEELIQ